ncbi:MAG: rod shape-determining protein MreC [Oscillospiraceae bacterium]|nr:rod shape-determining protein MreC [Oscillospiraceae bacterium]
MRDFFKSRGFKLLLVAVVILLCLVLFTLITKIEFLSSQFSFITAPIQKVGTEVSEAICELLPDSTSSEEYKNKIKDLEEEIERLRAITIDYYNIKKENIQYKEFCEFKKTHANLNFLVSSVVGRSPDEHFQGFTVDQGASSGIKIGNPVVTSKGLVGHVSSVGEISCHINTILSPEAKIGCICAETGDCGVISGNFKLCEQNLTRMIYLSPGYTLQPQNLIVTSGLGGAYPKDLVIGKVTAVKSDENNASKYAIIEPTEDIPNTKDVLIILGEK